MGSRELLGDIGRKSGPAIRMDLPTSATKSGQNRGR